MARNVFYSFHYEPDNWRASQVRNMGVVDGNKPASDNDWETVTRGGDGAIEKWIQEQMKGRSCAVLLIGAGTAGRKWINHEIVKSWERGLGLCGVYIHALKDKRSLQSSVGGDPFAGFTLGASRTPLSSVVPVYDPASWDSNEAYANIKSALPTLIEQAIAIRARY